MKTETTNLPGLLVIHPDVFGDSRGFFMESYNLDRYDESGVRADFRQDNISKSMRGTLRGLHFQYPPFSQGKLVSVICGAVYDVAVDIRKKSPTFGRWYGIELNEENKTQLWMPSGFAHGFLALRDGTIFSYKCTNTYSPKHEGGILWNDPEIGIDWPLEGLEPLLSNRDREQPMLSELGDVFTFNV